MIRAVLLDADGVLQSCPNFSFSVAALVPEKRCAAFAQALFDAEQPCLCGEADFGEALATVLANWKMETSFNDLMRAWNEIQTDEAVLRIVASVRRLGVTCCIASNQQSYRAKHMSELLGYAKHFDREFYSCAIRVAKPDVQYFREILGALSLRPDELLFIDDSLPNVRAASEVGLCSEHFPSNAGGAKLRELLHKYGLQVA